MQKTTLRLGTRGSALALKQAEMTEAALAAKFPDLTVERVVIKTTGDIRTDIALKDVAAAESIVDKGVFIKELEIALLNEEIDFAVHSLKDVPTVLEDAFDLVCTLPRAPIADVLITKGGHTLKTLPQGATVATSSVRRQRQLLHLRPDLTIVDIRGNVPTRLEKLAQSEEFDAIMLAEAGLVRLGYSLDSLEIEGETLTFDVLDRSEFLPAAGQGAVAMEIRKGDTATQAILEQISCETTFAEITAEREFLRLLDAGCHTPVGVNTVREGDAMSLSGVVFAEGEGAMERAPKTAQVQGDIANAKQLGAALFAQLS